MKLWPALLVFLVGCAGCTSIPEPRAEFAAALKLDFYGGSYCSGTAVSEYTVLSAAHCFDDGAEMGGMLINGQPAAYQVLANDGADHVLLRVTARQAHVAKVADAPQWGEPVAIIGNPAGLERLFRVGRVAGFKDNMGCIKGASKCGGFYLDLNTTGGDSGAGYFNRKGDLVGVHSGSFQLGIFKVAFSYNLAFTPEQWKAAGV